MLQAVPGAVEFKYVWIMNLEVGLLSIFLMSMKGQEFISTGNVENWTHGLKPRKQGIWHCRLVKVPPHISLHLGKVNSLYEVL